MTRIRKLVACASWIIFLAAPSACSDPTYTVVTFAVADAPHIDALRVRVVSRNETRLERTLARAEWEDGLAISPLDGETSGSFAVTAEAHGENHDAVAPVTLITGYVPHQTRYARIVLRPGCAMAVERVLPASALSARRNAEDKASVSCDPPREPETPGPTGMTAGSSAGTENQAGQAGEEPPTPPPVAGQRGPLTTTATTPAATSTTDCDAGLERDDAGDCTGPNECARDPSLCEPYGQCVDTPGGYRCECDRFYRSEGKTCVLVDPEKTQKDVSGSSACALELIKGVDNELRGFLLVKAYSFVGIAHDGSFAYIDRSYAHLANMTCGSREDRTVEVTRSSLRLHWIIFARDAICPNYMPYTISCRLDETRSRVLLDTAPPTYCSPTRGCCMDQSSCTYDDASNIRISAAEGSKITRVEFYVDFDAEQSGESPVSGLTDTAVWTLE